MTRSMPFSFPADVGEIVLDLVVVKGRLFRKDVAQQFPQLGDIPLLIAQGIDKLPHGLFGGYFEDLIESPVGGYHS